MFVNLVGPGQSPTDDSAIRRRIMRAAEELFKKLGFRAVTMEAVARDAAVAKATLYGHVRNKDELFRAVCERMALRMTRSFVGELRAEHRTVDARVRAAILGKQQLMLALVRGSPHSSEFGHHHAYLAGDLFAETDRGLVDALAAVLAEDPRLAGDAHALARSLFFGSGGIAAELTSAAELERAVVGFVAIQLAGARALSDVPA
jgi:AcrR family transcriptional regulator